MREQGSGPNCRAPRSRATRVPGSQLVSHRSNVTAIAALTSALGWATASPAQTAPTAQPTTAMPPSVGDEYTGPPNRAMLGIGMLTLIAGYVPAAVVASKSNATDGSLFAPLVGPWIDFGNRPGCGGLGQLSCSTETWNRTLLIADGVAQAWGLFATALSFFQKEYLYPKVQVAPASVGSGGYGVAAFGTF